MYSDKKYCNCLHLTYSSRNAGERGGRVLGAGEVCLEEVSLHVVLAPAQVRAHRRYPRRRAARHVVAAIGHTRRNRRKICLAVCRVGASLAVKNGFEIAEALAGRAHVPAHAAVGVVVRDRAGCRVPPNVQRVRLGLGPGGGGRGRHQRGVQGHVLFNDAQFMKRPDGRVAVDLACVHPVVLQGYVLDEEHVDAAALLVDHRDAVVAGHTLSVGGEDPGAQLALGVPPPHEGKVALVADDAGYEGVLPHRSDHRGRQAVRQTHPLTKCFVSSNRFCFCSNQWV